MKLFSQDELARLRSAQASSMNDACVIGRYVAQQDDYGQLIERYIYDGAIISCGFKQLSAREMALPSYSKLEVVARIRLIEDLKLTVRDRVKIIIRDGEPIQTEVFDVAGKPKRSRTVFVVNLKRVSV